MSDSPAGPAPQPSATNSVRSAAKVIIVSSVMFSFISYWRTAAVVLCDLASTAYYIGGIVEQSIGPAAPWFILAVMVFSFTVSLVYIESCTIFVRGGVYRVVRSTLGPFMGKLSVSALMFDFMLTGPISGVSAGHYIMSLALELLFRVRGIDFNEGMRDSIKNYGAMLIACGIIFYFYRQNLIGIHESSEKALKIMLITAVMGVVLLVWCGITLAVQGRAVSEKGAVNALQFEPSLESRLNHATGETENPVGFLKNTWLGEQIQNLRGQQWFTFIGVLGIFIAFGHSILAMSGAETMAQVYREVEAPKLQNFTKAAIVIFLFSLFFTGGASLFAVLLIPDDVRMAQFSDNLISGLAMNVIGPDWARLLLKIVVVVVGSLILAGAVNTSIIGSNGVLNRVAEDGVVPTWLQKPHKRYGTTGRILLIILGLQLFTIFISRGNVLFLGEAYAFGVVWSFVFQALSMVVLRFKDRRPREFKVPLNITIRGIEFPIGLMIVLVILLMSAIMNLLTKETATIGGILFTTLLFTIFTITERFQRSAVPKSTTGHIEQFNQEASPELSPESLGLDQQYRKLVAIRSPQNLFMLEKSLNETDPETTSVAVMTAKLMPIGTGEIYDPNLDLYDQQLMTAVVNMAERVGKKVKPLIVPTNNPLHAVLNTAKDLRVQELVMGASNKYTADEQLEQVAFYWISLHGGTPAPLTVRILTRDREMNLDLGGGNRIPKISERKARTVAELRAAGVGVDRVLLAHDGTQASSDLFQAVLTMLDAKVALALMPFEPVHLEARNGQNSLSNDQERARQLDRDLELVELKFGDGPEIVRLAREAQFDLIILPLTGESPSNPLGHLEERWRYVLTHAHCRVMLAATPVIPEEVIDTTPSVA